jgi:hypothetical protein
MHRSRILVIVLVLLAIGVLPGVSQASAAPTPAAPSTEVATIDLGGLFGGDENEADENEADENEGGPPAQNTQQSSGTSFGGLLAAVGLGSVGTIFLTRWFFRLRSWARGLRGGAA